MSSALSARPSLLPATAVLIVAGAAWLGIVIWARRLGAMPGTMGLSLVVFVVMWTLMMTAMMLPSAMPMITLYSRTMQSRRGLRMTQFGLGYLIVWGFAGLPAFAVAWLAGRIAAERPGWSAAAAATLFVAAGAYQLTPLKHSCLRHCRTPLSHLLQFGTFRGRLRYLRAGAHHGLFCLACCWALMALMIAFGVMNLVAMAAIAVVIAIEKQWAHGDGFARVVGVAALTLAVLVVLDPGLAPGLRGATMPAAGM